MTVKPYARPYASSDAGSLSAALVVRPTAAIDRLPPIAGEPSPIASRAEEQHDIFVRTLRDRGVVVHEMRSAEQSPTRSLVADCALLFPDGAVLARPSQIDRRGEVAEVEKHLADLGVPVIGRIEAPGLLDATDVAMAPGRVFVGVPSASPGLRRRSNEMGRKQLEAIATQQGFAVVELPVSPEISRLRDVFSVVGADLAVAAPSRVDATPSGLRIVELPRGEELAAGVVTLGERRVVGNLRFRRAIALMRAAKIAVEAIDMWEFGKAGFGPFALALPVKRA